MIRVKRVYEAPGPEDGVRVLVDRLWPRGLSKDKLPMDGWHRDVAPGSELRGWFGHNPDRWEEFKRRYFEELDARPEAWKPLVELARGDVTLLYSARDTEHNNAVALKEYLEARVRKAPGS